MQGSDVKFHNVSSSLPFLYFFFVVGLQQKRSDRELLSEGLAAGFVGPAWEVTLPRFSCTWRT